MAVFDAHKNLALATVAVAPSPALSGTSLIITAGFVGLFPAVPFNCTIWPSTASPTDANAEIVRVTNITGDIFTIVRAQEGTTAKAIAAGYRIGNTVTVKVFTDIENAVNSVSSQAIMSISAGASNATGNQVVFSNSNGVSFGASNNVITASFSGGGGGSGGAAISAGANSQNTGTVVFSNSNGVSFGLSNNGVLTASHNGVTNALTSQSNQAASASNGSFAFQTLGFSNANGVTFGTSAGSVITASVGTAAGGNSVNFSAGTTSNNLGSIVFSNSNGVSFGLDGGTITAQHNALTSQSNQAFSAQGGSSAFQTLNFANSNGITFTNSNGSVVASHNGLTSQSNQAASASNGSFAFQTLGFSNANNVTFGTSAGSIITASVAPPGAGSVNFSAGTTSNNLASVVFSNSNGVTFGLDGATITASVNAGGGAGQLLSFQYPDVLPVASSAAVIESRLSAAAFIMPLPIVFQYARLAGALSIQSTALASIASASASASGEINQTVQAIFYSLGTGASSQSMLPVATATGGYTFAQAISVTNSTQISVTIAATAFVGTESNTFSAGFSASSSNYLINTTGLSSALSSPRFWDAPLNSSLSAGNYWIAAGVFSSSNSAGAAGLSGLTRAHNVFNSLIQMSQADILFAAPGQTASLGRIGAGTFASSLSAGFDLSQVGRPGGQPKVFFQLLNQ